MLWVKSNAGENNNFGNDCENHESEINSDASHPSLVLMRRGRACDRWNYKFSMSSFSFELSRWRFWVVAFYQCVVQAFNYWNEKNPTMRLQGCRMCVNWIWSSHQWRMSSNLSKRVLPFRYAKNDANVRWDDDKLLAYATSSRQCNEYATFGVVHLKSKQIWSRACALNGKQIAHVFQS